MEKNYFIKYYMWQRKSGSIVYTSTDTLMYQNYI